MAKNDWLRPERYTTYLYRYKHQMKTKGRRDHQREPAVPGASTISLKHRTEILTRQKNTTYRLTKSTAKYLSSGVSAVDLVWYLNKKMLLLLLLLLFHVLTTTENFTCRLSISNNYGATAFSFVASKIWESIPFEFKKTFFNRYYIQYKMYLLNSQSVS